MPTLPTIPKPPYNKNGSLREDLTALGWVWGTFAQTITKTLPDLLKRLANDIDSHS